MASAKAVTVLFSRSPLPVLFLLRCATLTLSWKSGAHNDQRSRLVHACSPVLHKVLPSAALEFKDQLLLSSGSTSDVSFAFQIATD